MAAYTLSQQQVDALASLLASGETVTVTFQRTSGPSTLLLDVSGTLYTLAGTGRLVRCHDGLVSRAAVEAGVDLDADLVDPLQRHGGAL